MGRIIMFENRYNGYTEEELIKEAQAIQGACDLPGVLLSFRAAMISLRVIFEAKAKYTGKPYRPKDLYSHPVCKLFATKIQSLTES